MLTKRQIRVVEMLAIVRANEEYEMDLTANLSLDSQWPGAIPIDIKRALLITDHYRAATNIDPDDIPERDLQELLIVYRTAYTAEINRINKGE